MTIQKKPSKWDKPSEQRPADIISVVEERQNTMSLDHQNNVVKPSDGDVEPVQGSSSVYVVEEELPPPAFTRNIVAKFRELEATSSTDKTAPLAGRMMPTSSRSSRNPSDNLNVGVTYYSPPQHSSPDVADGSRLSAERRNGEQRGRTEKRSEVPQRESSSSRERSVASELPQQGLARSLLARWRTIEEQASHTQEDVPRRSSSAAKRSQSTSRIEVRQRTRSSVPSADDDQDSQRYCSVSKNN